MYLDYTQRKRFKDHARYVSHFCTPKTKDAKIIVISLFRPAIKYIHADQYWFDVTNRQQWFRRSTTDVYGSGTAVFTWPHYNEKKYGDCISEWFAYLNGEHLGKHPRGPSFMPGCNDQSYLEKDREEKRISEIYFLNKVQICPLCGDCGVSEPSPKVDIGEWSHYELYAFAEAEAFCPSAPFNKRWSGVCELKKESALYKDPYVYRRCSDCAKKRYGFREAWKQRLEWSMPHSIKSALIHYEIRDKVRDELRLIWPEDYVEPKVNLATAIFRQAKKRARIKPLSRGELAFFSMHLAATQMKELKALLNK